MSKNPYVGRPAWSYWKSGVSECPVSEFDLVVSDSLKFQYDAKICTAGSCFAQYVSQALVAAGANYLVTEKYEGAAGTTDENYGVFPARFANVYSVAQLVQLFDRAYHVFRPVTAHWRGKHGGYIDPFRPRIQHEGFATIEFLEEDRARHFAAVRRMFETADVFVFTAGLTEYWRSKKDRAAYPLAPGVVSDDIDPAEFEFHNASVFEVVDELDAFVGRLLEVNPRVKILLTVSPVPLVATYEDRHVVVSTVASKSILRAAVDEICRRHTAVGYFPSFEYVVGPQARGRLYAEDGREVTKEGVSEVMACFLKHFLVGSGRGSNRDHDPTERKLPERLLPAPQQGALSADVKEMLDNLRAVICDEEAIQE